MNVNNINIDTGQMLTTAVVIVLTITLRLVLYFTLKRISAKYRLDGGRKSMISKVIDVSLFLLSGLILLGIWEVDPDDLAIYITSVFAVIGIAFFAQWSHLSNITAAIILYFSHAIKIGDEISIHDGEYLVEGRIDDIGLFYINIVSKQHKKIKITNTLLMQKVVSIEKRMK